MHTYCGIKCLSQGFKSEFTRLELVLLQVLYFSQSLFFNVLFFSFVYELGYNFQMALVPAAPVLFNNKYINETCKLYALIFHSMRTLDDFYLLFSSMTGLMKWTTRQRNIFYADVYGFFNTKENHLILYEHMGGKYPKHYFFHFDYRFFFLT